jgi:hypothetical protein
VGHVRTVALVALAGACAVAPAASADSGARPRCAKPPQVGSIVIPAAVRVTTRCAVYTVSPSGRIAAAARPRQPQGITWMAVAGPNATVVQRRGRIAVLRGTRELWRSAGRFRAAGIFATVGPHTIAFSYESYDRRRYRQSLHVAQFGGREREIALDERPLGWTRDGELLTWRFRQDFIGLYLRSGDGKLIRRIGARLREIRFDPTGRTVVALARSGVLERFDGRRRQRLADLRALGFGRGASFERLTGGLVGIVENRRVAVLRADGSLFATARFAPRRGEFSVAGHSGLVADDAATSVVFAVTSGKNGSGKVGRESLFVLRAGDRRAREVYGARLRFAACGRWASLSWHGDWLLYATTEGRTVAIDTRSRGRGVDLTALVRRLASLDARSTIGAQVEWARPARR